MNILCVKRARSRQWSAAVGDDPHVSDLKRCKCYCAPTGFFARRWTAKVMRREVYPQVRVGEPEAMTAGKDMIKTYRCVVLVTLVEVQQC